jgi:DNA-binding phage protein
MEFDMEKINQLSDFNPKDYLTTPEAKEAYLQDMRDNGTPEDVSRAEKLIAEM